MPYEVSVLQKLNLVVRACLPRSEFVYSYLISALARGRTADRQANCFAGLRLSQVVKTLRTVDFEPLSSGRRSEALLNAVFASDALKHAAVLNDGPLC